MFAVFTFTQCKWSDLPSIYLRNEYLCADSAALSSSLMKGDDCASLLDCEDDNGQVCIMEDATECSHDLPT